MSAKFTSGSTMRHVVVMTSTASVGLLALFFVDAINLFYISLLGITELAAGIGFAATLQFFLISAAIGLMIGGTALVARRIGAEDREGARQMAGSALAMAVVVLGLIAALTWIWREPLLALLGAEGETLAAASRFLAIALPSVPLVGIGMACGGTLRAIGEARQAMYVTLGGGGVAAILDPILIFGFGLGLDGAAVAMALTRAAIAAIGLWLVIVRHDMLAMPSIRGIASDLPGLVRIALPAVATQLSTPFGNAYLTTTVAEHGDSAVAGWAVIVRISVLAFGGLYALAGAVGPIIGQNYGAGLGARIAQTYRDALIFVAGYVAVAWAVLWFATPFIVSGFGLDDAGAELVSAFTVYGAGAFVFTGALFVSNAAFNNLGRPIWSTAFNWTRDAAVIPVLAFLIAPALGPSGVVWVQAIAGILVGTAAGIAGWRWTRRAAPASRPVERALGDVPAVPLGSGRAATVGALSLHETPEPLASPRETR